MLKYDRNSIQNFLHGHFLLHWFLSTFDTLPIIINARHTLKQLHRLVSSIVHHWNLYWRSAFVVLQNRSLPLENTEVELAAFKVCHLVFFTPSNFCKELQYMHSTLSYLRTVALRHFRWEQNLGMNEIHVVLSAVE